jgi:Zn-dependent protease
MLVAAAGPASNLALGIAASLMLTVLPVSPVVLGELNVSAPLAAFLRLALQLNLLLAVFNMLPIPPLDGGNVLSGVLPRAWAQRLDQIRPYGFLLLYALILTDGYYYLVFQPYRFLRSLLP